MIDNLRLWKEIGYFFNEKAQHAIVACCAVEHFAIHQFFFNEKIKRGHIWRDGIEKYGKWDGNKEKDEEGCKQSRNSWHVDRMKDLFIDRIENVSNNDSSKEYAQVRAHHKKAKDKNEDKANPEK